MGEYQLISNATGRYGDSLNPWGDMMTVAGAWCVTTEDAQMAIGVPVTRSGGPGVLAFNAHRIYSADNYPYLVRTLTRPAVARDKPINSARRLDRAC